MNPLELFGSEPDHISYSADDVIFQEGDYGDHMYVILEGEIDILVADKVMQTVGKGEIIGEMSLVQNNPRSATTVTRTGCKLIPVDRKRFAELVQKSPQFSIYVMRVLAERLRRMNDLIRE